jgi:hypothetical protein
MLKLATALKLSSHIFVCVYVHLCAMCTDMLSQYVHMCLTVTLLFVKRQHHRSRAITTGLLCMAAFMVSFNASPHVLKEHHDWNPEQQIPPHTNGHTHHNEYEHSTQTNIDTNIESHPSRNIRIHTY